MVGLAEVVAGVGRAPTPVLETPVLETPVLEIPASGAKKRNTGAGPGGGGRDEAAVAPEAAKGTVAEATPPETSVASVIPEMPAEARKPRSVGVDTAPSKRNRHVQRV
jgi:hypothetical protein